MSNISGETMGLVRGRERRARWILAAFSLLAAALPAHGQSQAPAAVDAAVESAAAGQPGQTVSTTISAGGRVGRLTLQPVRPTPKSGLCRSFSISYGVQGGYSGEVCELGSPSLWKVALAHATPSLGAAQALVQAQPNFVIKGQPGPHAASPPTLAFKAPGGAKLAWGQSLALPSAHPAYKAAPPSLAAAAEAPPPAAHVFHKHAAGGPAWEAAAPPQTAEMDYQAAPAVAQLPAPPPAAAPAQVEAPIPHPAPPAAVAATQPSPPAAASPPAPAAAQPAAAGPAPASGGDVLAKAITNDTEQLPIVYNMPPSLAMDHSTPVSVIVASADVEHAVQALAGFSGGVRQDVATLSSVVTAKLTGDPEAVTISARDPDTQALSHLANVQWIWDVRAKKPGPTTLTLQLFDVLPVEGKPMPVQILAKTVKITTVVDPIDWTTYEIGRIDPIYKFLGLGTPVALVAGFYAWLRQRKKKQTA